MRESSSGTVYSFSSPPKGTSLEDTSLVIHTRDRKGRGIDRIDTLTDARMRGPTVTTNITVEKCDDKREPAREGKSRG